MSDRYVVGIDLGTTNSVMAYAPLDVDQPDVQLLSVPQLVAAGTMESRTALPSFAYLATKEEAKGDPYKLSWAKKRDFAVGELARKQAADVPDRTVGAAKSWLCYSRIDRREAILPWGAQDEVDKISPLTASEWYLAHLVAAWNEQFPQAPLADQAVVLTVPASFDASARELTHEAAINAGLPQDLILLEEPQAAVYAWVTKSGERWRRQVAVDDLILVCDVGGGTTDLSLIRVCEENGEFILERRAVGNHLLVGGDNMDLALAHHVAGLFQEKNVSLDPWQSVALWHSCRTAKESLLADGAPNTHPVSVLGRGSKLVGGTVTVDVPGEDVSRMLLDGFFPACKITDSPTRERSSGFQQIGLPYESDSAITRHVAEFLSSHSDEEGRPAQPTHVVFNGGVFKSQPFADRLREVVTNWFGKKSSLQELKGAEDLDHAVAIGAAYYGWSKEQGGIRIRGGTARASYVGIETTGPAIPGAARPLSALCVVPIGMEEGTETDVPSDEIGLVVGEEAQFRFFSSSTRKQDRPGDMLRSWNDEELSETDSMSMTLPADESIEEGYVPVRFHSRITELGMLELWCYSTRSEGKWKLEFNVRDDADDD